MEGFDVSGNKVRNLGFCYFSAKFLVFSCKYRLLDIEILGIIKFRSRNVEGYQVGYQVSVLSWSRQMDQTLVSVSSRSRHPWPFLFLSSTLLVLRIWLYHLAIVVKASSTLIDSLEEVSRNFNP